MKFGPKETKELNEYLRTGRNLTREFMSDERTEFQDGTPKNFNRNPTGINQHTLRTDAEIQKIIDDPKYKDYTRKDFRNEKILTRKETERPNLKFKNFGKKIKVDKRATQNLKQSQFIKGAQGSAISMDKINNFAHFAPKLKSYLVSTANTGPLKSSINRAAEGYDVEIRKIAEEQENLVTNKPKGYKKLLEKVNAKAAKLSKDFTKLLPNELKGTLGYFKVNEAGEFLLKGVDKAKTFAGLPGDEKVFKTDMTTPERKDFGKTQSTIQKLIDETPGLKRASSLVPKNFIDIIPFKPLKLVKPLFAEGGLSGGDKSGPPPERGPNPQGLLSLMKRARNY